MDAVVELAGTLLPRTSHAVHAMWPAVLHGALERDGLDQIPA
jgi:hypothetical protein